MIKIILKTLLTISIILIVLFSIMIAAISFFDANKYKDVIEKVFHQQTGQTLLLKGPVKIKIFPFPKAHLENASFQYHFKEKYFTVTAEKLSFRIDWSFLFSSDIHIHAIDAYKMAVQYVENEHLQKTFLIDDFKGQFYTSCCDMTLSNFKLQSGNQKMQGSVKLSFGPLNAPPKLTGDVTLSELNLTKEAFAKKENSVNATSLLPLLNGIDGELDLKIKKINLAHLKLSNATVAFRLQDNKLVILPKGKIAGSLLKGQITISPLNKTAKLDADFNMENVDAGLILKNQIDDGFIEGGKLSFIYEANSEGADFSSLISQLKSKLMIQLKEVKIPYYQGIISGDLQIDLEDLSRITGKLSSPDWIVPLVTYDNTKSEKIISRKHWAFDKLSGLGGKIDIDLKRLHFENMEVDNAKLQLNLHPQSFEVLSQGELTSGKYVANFVVTPNENGISNIQGKISIENANATDFLKQFNQKLNIQNGRLNLEFAGNGKGDNLAELMSQLSGKGLITINDLDIPQLQIDSRYVDFFSATLKALIPKSKKGTKLECFVMKFNVNDGILTSKEHIGMQTRDLYALGGGELNFKTEKMNFEIDLYPRSQVNIEIGSYNNIIRIKGTLSQPQVAASMSGLVKEGGTIVLGIATGGLSLFAEKLFKMTTQKKSPCKQVLSSPEK